MTFLELAKARYSCRQLTNKEIGAEKIERILQATIAAPTAKNLQPYKIWKITSESARAKIEQVAKFPFVKQANLVFVIGVKKDSAFTRPFDNLNYAEIDGSIIATHLMLAVKAEGLDTTWVGYFDAPKLQELIPEMQGYELIAIFPVGYAAENATPSNRHEERRAISDAVAEI